MSEDTFFRKARGAIEAARSSKSPDVVILVGGNPSGRDDRQQTIYELISYCDEQGQHSLWFESIQSMVNNLHHHLTIADSFAAVELDRLLEN